MNFSRKKAVLGLISGIVVLASLAAYIEGGNLGKNPDITCAAIDIEMFQNPETGECRLFNTICNGEPPGEPWEETNTCTVGNMTEICSGNISESIDTSYKSMAEDIWKRECRQWNRSQPR